MERIKPMLGDVELQQVQQLNIDADQVLTEHEIPALEGNFYQQEGADPRSSVQNHTFYS